MKRATYLKSPTQSPDPINILSNSFELEDKSNNIKNLVSKIKIKGNHKHSLSSITSQLKSARFPDKPGTIKDLFAYASGWSPPRALVSQVS